MKLLSVCIYVGILLFLVDLSLAKRRDENSIDVSDEAQDDEGEEEDAPKKRRINKKHSKKQSDEEDYDEDDDTFYVCIKDDKDPICKCDDNILNCENGDLDETDVYVKDNQFVIKTANFKNNKIKTLKTKGVLPGAFEVEELDFSKNLIKKIEDKCFNGFDDLKILRLSSNRLTTVSNRYLTEKIGNSLHQLFLDDNLIVKIPATAFSELKNLKKLVLDGNANIKLSKTTFSTALANLEILSLDRCNISDLEDNVFEQLTNLEQLSLRNNPIVAIPKAINAIPNLFALDLSATEICEFTADKISADHNLTEIHLSNMKCLYAVYDCAFCSLSKLEIVDLSNNTQLYNIHENAFGAITKEKDSAYVVANLKEFDIQNSNFSILPQKLFDWSKIKTLKIHGNPFNCSCDLAWLVNDKNIHYETNPKCGAPAALNGTYFSKVADSVCDGKTSASSGSSSVLWAFVLFLTVIGLVGGFLLYTRRVRVTNILYRPEVPQMGYSNLTTQQQHPSQHDDEEELQGDFQPRPDATPV